VHYLKHAYHRGVTAALLLAAAVLLLTPLRHWMNLVAKEYVASRWAGGEALALTEFTGRAVELTTAFQCNPHDIVGLKQTILRAMHEDPADRRKRMLAMRRRVRKHDVFGWARRYLSALEAAPDRPAGGGRPRDRGEGSDLG